VISNPDLARSPRITSPVADIADMCKSC
jgi:hypothetical protein